MKPLLKESYLSIEEFIDSLEYSESSDRSDIGGFHVVSLSLPLSSGLFLMFEDVDEEGEIARSKTPIANSRSKRLSLSEWISTSVEASDLAPFNGLL